MLVLLGSYRGYDQQLKDLIIKGLCLITVFFSMFFKPRERDILQCLLFADRQR